jgi:hypothetical protein
VDSKKLLKIALIVTILGGFFIIYSTFNPSGNSLFIPCPFRYVSGFYCPGCGSQRAIHQLLHLNFIAAFRLNPFMVLSIPLILYGLLVTAWNYVFETQYRIKFFYSKLFIYGYFGLAVMYWVLRNISYYPFNLLAPSE